MFQMIYTKHNISGVVCIILYDSQKSKIAIESHKRSAKIDIVNEKLISLGKLDLK